MKIANQEKDIKNKKKGRATKRAKQIVRNQDMKKKPPALSQPTTKVERLFSENQKGQGGGPPKTCRNGAEGLLHVLSVPRNDPSHKGKVKDNGQEKKWTAQKNGFFPKKKKICRRGRR